jgi:hypothetical protein
MSAQIHPLQTYPISLTQTRPLHILIELKSISLTEKQHPGIIHIYFLRLSFIYSTTTSLFNICNVSLHTNISN